MLSRDHCWSFNCQPVYDRIEFLLLVEFLKSFILENGEAIAGDIKHKGFVDLGRQRRKMHILNCLFHKLARVTILNGLVHPSSCL
jgi:hypothetical protein